MLLKTFKHNTKAKFFRVQSSEMESSIIKRTWKGKIKRHESSKQNWKCLNALKSNFFLLELRYFTIKLYFKIRWCWLAWPTFYCSFFFFFHLSLTSLLLEFPKDLVGECSGFIFTWQHLLPPVSSFQIAVCNYHSFAQARKWDHVLNWS